MMFEKIHAEVVKKKKKEQLLLLLNGQDAEGALPSRGTLFSAN